MTRIAGSPCLHLGTLSRLLSRPHARTGLAAGWLAPVLVALSSTLADVPALARTSHDFSGVERRAAKEVEDGNAPSLALAIAKDGKIVYERAFGYADLGNRTAATTLTAYSLASASKPITATALMVLHERTGLDLAAPVETCITPLRFRAVEGSGERVSLIHLLSHTSGLGTYARIYYGDQISQEGSFERAFRDYGVLVHPAGRVSEYSNLGYGLISHVIEQRSGESFAQYLKETVFEPLGMKNSFVDSPAPHDVAVAKRYDASMAPLPDLYNDTPGAGNIYASVHDLVRFAMFHLNPEGARERVLSRKNVELMQTNVVGSALHHYYGASYYGFGWYVRPNNGGFRVAWHEGGMPGASTILKMLPEQNIAVAVLTNRTDANGLTDSLANQLIQVLLPTYAPKPLDPTANYSRYVSQQEFLGRWIGAIEVEGVKLPCALFFGPDGDVRFTYTDDPTTKAPKEVTLRGKVFGDSFISAFAGSLPSHDIDRTSDPLLLLKLLRSGNGLSGTVVAYASPNRLVHLLPFYIWLERKSDS